MSRLRRLTVSLHTVEGGYRLDAECEAEVTSWFVLNPGDLLPMPDPDHLDEDPFARELALEHFGRCETCRAWMERPA